MAYRLDVKYRERLGRHMAMAGLNDPVLTQRAIEGVGVSMLEAPWLWGYSNQQIGKWVICEQEELMRKALAGKEPVVFLTPHLGSFEMTARYCASLGHITVLYREPKLFSLRLFMSRIRANGSLSTAPASLSGVKAMLKALKAHQAIGILPDQVPTSGEGQWARFFGQYAYTMSLPERLAKTTQARVVLLGGEPLPYAQADAPRWRLHVQEMHEQPTPENINRQLEQMILRMPHLYLWGYNRYKQPMGTPPPPHDQKPVSQDA